jgi:hypothetical protein
LTEISKRTSRATLIEWILMKMKARPSSFIPRIRRNSDCLYLLLGPFRDDRPNLSSFRKVRFNITTERLQPGSNQARRFLAFTWTTSLLGSASSRGMCGM